MWNHLSSPAPHCFLYPVICLWEPPQLCYNQCVCKCFYCAPPPIPLGLFPGVVLLSHRVVFGGTATLTSIVFSLMYSPTSSVQRSLPCIFINICQFWFSFITAILTRWMEPQCRISLLLFKDEMSLIFNYLILCMCICVCMLVRMCTTCMQCSQKPEDGTGYPRSAVKRPLMWILGTKPESFARAASPPDFWATFSAP